MRFHIISAALLLSASPALAQPVTCATNLQSVEAKITTPRLRANLGAPLSQAVDSAGGVDQAIAKASEQVEILEKQKSAAARKDSKIIDDVIAILKAEIEALQCSKSR